jgi:hypothetical protein
MRLGKISMNWIDESLTLSGNAAVARGILKRSVREMKSLDGS